MCMHQSQCSNPFKMAPIGKRCMCGRLHVAIAGMHDKAGLYHVAQGCLQSRRAVCQQALGHVGVRLIDNCKVWVPRQRNALQDRDGPDDECKVGGYAEGVVKCDLCQVRGQFLKVDVFGATALQSLVKDLQPQMLRQWLTVSGSQRFDEQLLHVWVPAV